MKDAVATMGAILPDDAGGRDAVHVAVISAVAGHRLTPGQDVGFVSVDGPGEYTAMTSHVTPIGIVDPFIKGAVEKGQRFWLYLYPRTITGLSHRWTHPALADDVGSTYAEPSAKLASEQWLRAFIANSDCPDYDTLMAVATGNLPKLAGDEDYYYIDDNSFHIGGHDASGKIPPEFWNHIEIVTGRKMEKRPTYFSCSC